MILSLSPLAAVITKLLPGKPDVDQQLSLEPTIGDLQGDSKSEQK